MSSSRATILAAIRLAGPTASGPGLVGGGPPAVPAVGPTGGAPLNLLDELRVRSLRFSATFAAVANPEDVPAAVAGWLRVNGLPARVVLGDDVRDVYPWRDHGDVDWTRGPVAPDGDVLVTGAVGAIALEGAIVLASSASHSTGQTFLAASHVAILEERNVVATFADLWTTLRGRYAPGQWPRSINVVLGPSRTADLGVPSRLGAHGPARVHIIVVRDATGEPAC